MQGYFSFSFKALHAFEREYQSKRDRKAAAPLL